MKADSQYKARLITKEFMQIEGIDFHKTFSLITRYEAIYFLLTHATLENWEIKVIDIKTVFLYVKLDKEI